MKTLAGLDYQERGAGAVVCLVHAGVFGAWFEPVFDQPGVGSLPVDQADPTGLRRQPGAVRACQPRRASQSMW